MMRILGIDPGTRAMGFGVIDTDRGRDTLVAVGSLEASARAPLAQRLVVLRDGLAAVIAREKPDVAAVEQAFHGRNAQALIAMGEGRGIALLCAAEVGLAVFDYPPAKVKKALTGNGAATKEQVARMVRALLAALPEELSVDASDALAVALCHARRVGAPETGARAPAVTGPLAALLAQAARAQGARTRRGRRR